MPDYRSQLPCHRPFAPGEVPPVRDGPLLNKDRDVVPEGDLVRVPASLFRPPANLLQFPVGLLWLQELIGRQPAVRFAPDEVEHPIPEHTEPERNGVAGLGFDGGSISPEVLSCVREAGSTPQATQDVNRLFECLHLLAGRTLTEAKSSICRLVHLSTAAEHEDEPTA